MIITSEFFSFNVWEWFLHSSVLERTESDLLKINWLRGVILLIPIVLVPWGRFPLCRTPIKSISGFRDQISILIVGCVTKWQRDHEVRISWYQSYVPKQGHIILLFSFFFFTFFSVPLSFSVLASIFLFFESASSKQKKKSLYFIWLLSLITSVYWKKKKKERKKERKEWLVEIRRIIQFLLQKHKSWWTISNLRINLNFIFNLLGVGSHHISKLGLLW